jgi:mono/diheme cytochrome c family protein
LPCLGCHELDGEGGRVAPSLTTVAGRRDAAYIGAIIDDPQRVVPGAAMPKTPMAASARELITEYLARGAQQGIAPEAPQLRPSPARDGAPSSLYNRWCAACHGPSGGGDGPNAKYLPVRPAIHNSAAQMRARSDDALFDAIAGGGAIMGKSPRMPAFGATLSPPEIRSLVSYIRTLCACEGPAWSRDNAKP